MGGAAVSMVGGKACFAPAQAELSRQGASDIDAVLVTDMSAQPVKEVWAVQLDYMAGPFRLQPGVCLAYGQAMPFVLSQLGPQELTPGHVYHVYLKPRLRDSTDSTRGFSAEFCLLRRADHSLRVHQIQWDAKAGKWQRDACFGK